jgi:hypothetical protein
MLKRTPSLRACVAASALFGCSLGHYGSSEAVVVGGGGSAKSDCLVVFDAAVNLPVSNPRDIRCVDGDSCDADGVANGVCEFPISMCANSTFDAGNCSLAGVQTVQVDHADDNGDPKFDPELQALENRFHSDIGGPPTVDTLDECFSAPTNIHVAVKGPYANDRCSRNKKKIRVTSQSTVLQGKVYVDVDKITLICEPPVSGCDPQAFYDDTFDRIQKQVFNQSCAVSGCHDSQSDQADLLLETGASLAQLITVDPTNPAAAILGWSRVVPGDPSLSFLLHKINGDLPGPEFGVRMPKDHKKLNRALIDVITLWIQAGAPDSGWVPGTD